MQIQRLTDATQVARRAAEILDAELKSSQGEFNLALSGGSTPKTLYRMLSGEDKLLGKDIDRISWYFGDERFVPPDDEQSNYRMALENLFEPAGIAEGQVHRVLTELGDPAAAADDYNRKLQSNLPLNPAGVPVFNVVLLGIGADGHTASLFPHTSALLQSSRNTTENYVEKLDAWRITLTIPVLLAATTVIVMVAGKDKAEALKQVLEGPKNIAELPSQCLRRRSRATHWLVDEQASATLG